ACSLIFLPGGFGGWIVGVIRFEDLLNGIWYEELAQGYSVSLLYSGREVYSRRAGKLAMEATPQEVVVDLASENMAGISLRLRVWPSPSLLATRSSLPSLTAAVGVVVSGL